MTPQLLLAAYVASTNLTVTMSYSREMSLTDAVQRGITPEDVTMVCEELKKLIKRDTKGTYTWTSLEFRNVFQDVDRLEERILTLRQRKARLQPPKAQQQATRETGQGKIFVLDDPPQKDVPPIDLKSSLINLANNIRSA